jgi:nicotinamidase-related amidase
MISNMAHDRKSASRKSKSKSDDLHGNAPDRSQVAVLLVDVINDLNLPQNEQLVRNSFLLAKRITKLKRRCKRPGIPAIYINDNRGKWRSEFPEVLNPCLRPDSLGRAMVKQLIPDSEDYVVLKPKHSPFYPTPLELLVEYIGVKTVILAGITTNACA